MFQILIAVEDFTINQRVQSHPATNVWMSGDRWGVVEKLGRRYVHVRMDRSGKVRRFLPMDLIA